MSEVDLVTRGGIVVFRNSVAKLEPPEHFPWVDDLVRRGAIEAPRRHQDRLLREIAELPNGMEIDLPEDLGHRPRHGHALAPGAPEAPAPAGR